MLDQHHEEKDQEARDLVTLKTTLKAKKTSAQDSSSSSESDGDLYGQCSWIFVSRVDASCGSAVCPFMSSQNQIRFTCDNVFGQLAREISKTRPKIFRRWKPPSAANVLELVELVGLPPSGRLRDGSLWVARDSGTCTRDVANGPLWITDSGAVSWSKSLLHAGTEIEGSECAVSLNGTHSTRHILSPPVLH